MSKKVTFEDLKNNSDVNTYIKMADKSLSALGFTEHSFAHVTKVSATVKYILETMGYSEREVELGMMAGYLHDIGNVVNRVDHSQSGAIMAFRLLDHLDMPAEEIAFIISAIGNHDEGTGVPVNAVAAALILADKSDVRRSRVRNRDISKFDIHDRVNYAVDKSKLAVDPEEKKITLYLTVDENISHISEYFEIFLNRMLLCRRAADYFRCSFEVNINGSRVM